jgi:hypothetical protein
MSMFGEIQKVRLSIIFGSVLVLLFTLIAPSVNVSAQDAPDYLMGNLTLNSKLTTEQVKEIGDKIANYTGTMLKEANGNITKMNVLLTEDMAKRNIIDQEAKEDLLSLVASLTAGNLTKGNVTDILKDLNTSSALLDEIAKNNSDSQTVSLMSEILKKRITDIGNAVSGNVTDVEVPTMTFMSDGAYLGALYGCEAVGLITYGFTGAMVAVQVCAAFL